MLEVSLSVMAHQPAQRPVIEAHTGAAEGVPMAAAVNRQMALARG